MHVIIIYNSNVQITTRYYSNNVLIKCIIIIVNIII
jgi:hypothetical protein